MVQKDRLKSITWISISTFYSNFRPFHFFFYVKSEMHFVTIWGILTTTEQEVKAWWGPA